MMTSFDERENAFETEFAHREEFKFRVRERALRALAIWAADRLGKTGEAAEAYAAEVVAADVMDPKTTIDRIAADLIPARVYGAEVRRMLDRLSVAADAELRSPVQS